MSISGISFSNAGYAYSMPYPSSSYGSTGAENAGVPSGYAAGEEMTGAVPEDKAENVDGHSTPADCETCKHRKYQDGSNEMVSFKTPGHIDPGSSASVVLGHEHEHVANAYQRAAENNGEVMRCSVQLKHAICPECGRSYVSGGTTSTQIRYYNEENPYQKDLKEMEADNKYRGMNVDFAA